MEIGDFVIGQFDGASGVDERLCLITDFHGVRGVDRWFDILFLEDGAMCCESLPETRVKPAGFDFARLTDEWDTQGDLSQLAALPEQRRG